MDTMATMDTEVSRHHRALDVWDIEGHIVDHAIRRQDGCALLIAQDHFCTSPVWAPHLHTAAVEWAFAPGSPWVKAAAERFRSNCT